MEKTFALLALLAGFQTSAWAQAPQSATAAPTHQAAGERHAHPSPHGGVVHAAGAHHLEAVLQGQQLTVYMYDGKMQPLPTKQVSGSVLLEQGGKPVLVSLVASGGDRLQAQLPAGAEKGPATVQLTSGKQPISARFESLSLSPATEAAYSCPMHPTETSATPGKCGKCHMNLQKRS